MQSQFFEVWTGTWPEAIDWTAAVMGTQVSAALHALTASSNFNICLKDANGLDGNLVNRFFSQITAFYFGENALSLRTQAYDDMLWVVLGWLEATQFIKAHSDLHFAGPDDETSHWFAKQWVPAFAHRARIFWELASHGWDTTLCGGGMVWSPYVAPYKNAITNELWIAASINMYLYFPGDDNASPFAATQEAAPSTTAGGKHDVKFLDAAIAGYRWLRNSNMTNELGLYADGYHVSGWRGEGDPGSGVCDEVTPAVYTYNQGVLLSGLRGLTLGTGEVTYLADGHDLIRNVIAATGWSLATGSFERTGEWRGIGRNGVLEEQCDAGGDCNQNGQTFKGIFFHHFTVFCNDLPAQRDDADSVVRPVSPGVADLHRRSCAEYAPWVRHNAEAAMRVRNEEGKFGMWWTPGLFSTDEVLAMVGKGSPAPMGPDYRNKGIPDDPIWRLAPGTNETAAMLPGAGPLDGARRRLEDDKRNGKGPAIAAADPNERGRGRTVETQSGGMAVLRAAQLFDQLHYSC